MMKYGINGTLPPARGAAAVLGFPGSIATA
jgi:hypothetical protein